MGTSTDIDVAFAGDDLVLRLACAAYLARYTGSSRHADPRTTMRYDRARTNLDRHPNYILAAYMTSGT